MGRLDRRTSSNLADDLLRVDLQRERAEYDMHLLSGWTVKR